MKGKQKHILLLATIVALIAANQVVIQYLLASKKEDAKMINVAGRQRMLSQKITLLYYRSIDHPTSLDSLKSSINEWEVSNQALIYGGTNINIDGVQDASIKEKLSRLQFIINDIKKLSSNASIDKRTADLAYSTMAPFLPEMESAVKDLETNAELKLRRIITIELILAFISLMLIAIEFRFLLYPMYQRISDSEKRLKTTLESIPHSIIIIDHEQRIAYINNEFSNLFGYTFQSLYGKNILQYPDLNRVISSNKHETSSTNIKSHTLQSGKKILTNTSQNKYSHEGVEHTLFILQDITDNQEKEALINHQEQTLDNIAWSQSHELRRSVANILGLCEILNNTAFENQNEIRKITNLLSEEGEKADTVIHKIVAETRLQKIVE